MWHRLKLRGRLLMIMLTVALAAVLISVGCFAFTLTHMLQSSSEDARQLSDNVHHMVEMAFYQQQTHIREMYAMSQANLLDRRLQELAAQQQTPDWNALLDEAYDLVNNSYVYPDLLETEGAVVFLLVDDTFYVHGTDMQTFISMVDGYYTQLYEAGESPDRSYKKDLCEHTSFASYTRGVDGMLLAWYPFGEGDYRVGMFVPNVQALATSEGLRQLMDTETGKTIESMTKTARRSAMVIVIATTLLLIVLPFASRHLARVIVNPVEREQERQRDFLRVVEEEKALLERLGKLKTEFLGNVSHELKTPLTVISGYAQYSQKILAETPGMSEVENNIKLIGSEADRLALMVTQILDSVRIEEGRMMMDARSSSIAAIIQRTVNTYYPLFAKNNNVLKIEHSASLPNVFCDENRISQVLVNLISNAAKHTRDGEIKVSTEALDSYIAVTVSDTGEGIAPECLPHLFERFKSYTGEEEARAGLETGTGLGLYICKHIIQTHGGEITVSSHIGEGTAVSFTLPVERI